MNAECGSAIVFLGPTLELEQARLVFPATYKPPARQSDLLLSARSPVVRTIVLIDGEFGQSLSVWHKEILFALSEGIRVIGCSSMGALRAAELNHYGMLGFGKIYSDYASGRLIDDDEVAVLHSPSELGYHNLTLPLINVRYTLEAALGRNEIDEAMAARCLTAASSVFFQDRTVDKVLQACKEMGWRATDIVQYEHLLLQRYVDQKKEDAIRTLEHASLPNTAYVSFSNFNRSYCFVTQLDQDLRAVRAARGATRRQVSKFVALHHGEFQKLLIDASNRALVQILGHIIGVAPEQSEIENEATRFRSCYGLLDEARFAKWLDDNDITESEFLGLSRRICVCRKMYRWLLAARGKRENTELVLNELRLRREYERWAEAAIEHREALQRFGHGAGDELPRTDHIIRDHLSNTDWDIDTDLETWSAEAGYVGVEELIGDLASESAVRDKLRAIAREIADDLG